MKVKKYLIRLKCAFLYKVGVHFPHVKIRIKSLRALGYEIGKDAYVAQDLNVTVSYVENRSNLTIGDRCSIGPRVILAISSHSNSSRLKEMLPPMKKGITIGHDTWLGAGVIVLPGITIGEMCVIGAGSVVTKDIPPYSIAVGNPARVIKSVKEKMRDTEL